MWEQCKLAQLFCHYSILDIHYVFRKMVMPFASDISIKWAEHWDKLALNALVCVCLVLEWFYSYTIKMTLAKHQQHINYVYHRLSVTNLIGVNRICRASMKIDCAKHAWLFLQCRRFSHKLFKCQVRFGSIKTNLSAFPDLIIFVLQLLGYVYLCIQDRYRMEKRLEPILCSNSIGWAISIWPNQLD